MPQWDHSSAQLFGGPGGLRILVGADWSSTVAPSGAQIVTQVDGSLRGSINFENVQVVAAAFGGGASFDDDAFGALLEGLELIHGGSGYAVDPNSLGDDFTVLDDSRDYDADAALPSVSLDYALVDGRVVTSAAVPPSWSIELAGSVRALGDYILSDSDRTIWLSPGFDAAPSLLRWIEDGTLITVASRHHDLDDIRADIRDIGLLTADELASQVDEVRSQRLQLPLMTTAFTDSGTVEVRGTNLDNRVVCIEVVCAPLRGLATLASIATDKAWLIVSVVPREGPQPKITTAPSLALNEGSGDGSQLVSVAEVPAEVKAVHVTVEVQGLSLTWDADPATADTAFRHS